MRVDCGRWLWGRVDRVACPPPGIVSAQQVFRGKPGRRPVPPGCPPGWVTLALVVVRPGWRRWAAAAGTGGALVVAMALGLVVMVWDVVVSPRDVWVLGVAAAWFACGFAVGRSRRSRRGKVRASDVADLYAVRDHWAG